MELLPKPKAGEGALQEWSLPRLTHLLVSTCHPGQPPPHRRLIGCTQVVAAGQLVTEHREDQPDRFPGIPGS